MPKKPVRRRRTMPLLGAAVFALCVFAGCSARLIGQASTSVTVGVTVSGQAIPVHLVAIPEKRVPSTGNNGTLLTVEVRETGTTSPIFSETVLTSSGGTYSGLLLTGLNAGTYDVTAKGYSHLRLKKANVAVSSGVTIDFTNAGADPLLCGDVNSTAGDNKVNGIDLTLIVGGLNGPDTRLDLNRDGRVNGIDLTNAVTNLNDVGDA